jgi:pimeloyl-ACP methyl ester carboxylesterase
MPEPIYAPRRASRSEFVTLRGLRHHLLHWGVPSPDQPTLVMLHGWMDVAASFQFVVDALPGERHIVAMDWRGFGLSETPSCDSYWYPDYLGDLDALLDALPGKQLVDLLGHSMGGNVVMLYAGVRPQRIRRLINLEGFGMPATVPAMAPKRYAQWLDELKQPATLAPYPSAEAVAQRLRKNNPRLAADKAAWLAREWAEPGPDGRWRLRAHAAHKHINPMLYQVDEVLECWKRIEAPLLWVEGDQTDLTVWWGQRYTREEFHRRLEVVRQVEKHMLTGSGHMLHHDQPEALAAHIARFLGQSLS